MLNDCHVHWGKSSTIYRTIETEEQLLAFRDMYQIDQLVLLPFDVNTQVGNFQIAALGKKHDWIKPFYWIMREHVDEVLVTDVFAGYKFHGSYDKKPITHPDYEMALRYIDKKDKPLLVHCGRYLEGDARSNTSYIHALEVARQYPNIKVILGHMGGSDTTIIKKALEAAKDIPNIWLDTSGITTPYIIEHVYRQYPQFTDRLLFGSDSPWCSFGGQRQIIVDADIPDKRGILYDNFSSLFS